MTCNQKSTGLMKVPYEGLNSDGAPVWREARVVGELPHNHRFEALERLAPIINRVLGLSLSEIKFGVPLHRQAGLKRSELSNHSQRELLMKPGCDIPLSLLQEEI